MDVPIQKRRFSTQKIVTIGGILLLVALIIYVIFQTSGGSKLNIEKERISINTVKNDVFQENIPVNGIVLAHNHYLFRCFGRRTCRGKVC